MKLAVVSDIHGNLPALRAVLEDIGNHNVDQILNLGDILSGPLQPGATADFLMPRGWVTIAGNHERQLLKLFDGPKDRIDAATSDGYAATQITPAHAAWLRSLPPTLWLTPEVLLVHGTPASDLVYWLETVTPDFGQHGSPGIRAASGHEVAQRLQGPGTDKASLILCGHSHIARVVTCGETLVVNPGSVGLQAYEGDLPHLHHTENGTPHARYALVERLRRGWAARLCSVPYDHAAMAQLAAQRSRLDWAYALATGRMPERPATIRP